MKLSGTWKAVAKTVTYRMMNSVYGFSVAYFVTGKLSIAATVVGAEAAYKTFAYFGHEKAWEFFSASGTEGAASHG